MRDVLEGEPAEKPQLHHSALSQIERRQLGKRRVQIEEVDIWRVALRDGLVEGHPGPSARPLGHLAAPGMVHQDPPHHLGRDGEEVCSTLPIGLPLVDESKVRLVNQGSRLQDVSRSFVPKSRRRPSTQLLMHHHHELVPRGQIPSTPRVQECRHVVVGTDQRTLRAAILTLGVPRVKAFGPRSGR